MEKYFLEINEEACIGCAACPASCPEYFEMKETKSGPKAKALHDEFLKEDLLSVKEASDVCPVKCIHIKDSEGKDII